MTTLAQRICILCASKRRFPSVPILVGSLLMLGWAAHALDADEIVTRHTEALGGKTRLAALQSLRLVGKISFGSGDFSIDLAWTAAPASNEPRTGFGRAQEDKAGFQP